jgi:hypothetical protein
MLARLSTVPTNGIGSTIQWLRSTTITGLSLSAYGPLSTLFAACHLFVSSSTHAPSICMCTC